MHSRLTRLYYFLAGKWHIPLEPSHYLDLLVLFVLACLIGFLTLWQGGMSAEALPWAARIFAVALSFHVFAIVQRSKTGFGLRPSMLVFLPWLIWVLFDWLFFSPKPWLAEVELITSIMVFGVFGLSLYHFRHEWLRWIIIGILVAFVSVAASLALGDQQHMMRTILDKEISPVYDGMFSGTLGHPAAIGALLLMAFFPACSVLVGRRWGFWQRLLAAYFSIILAIGIFCTHHIGVWMGFLVGMVILSSLLVKKILGRGILIVATLFVMYWGVPFLHTDVGCLRQIDQQEDSSKSYPLLNASWDAFKQAPIQGVGQGGFAGAFEKSRPGKWETTPATPGSLPLTILAENGLVGFILLLGPACWIWFVGLSACLKLPFYERQEKEHKVVLSVRKEGGRRVTRMIKEGARIIPEPRISLAGLLSG
ncbi:MAG: O-antigen ligase family protein, partial [Puniceicoccales bacterium]|nr:O-antigen ligase family protein [Puniceicoccales bacterium]